MCRSSAVAVVAVAASWAGRWAAPVVAALLVVLVGSPASADAVRDQQWHLSFLKAEQVHKITQGKGATVAVVDTGVDAKHPDLTGNVLKGKDLSSTVGGEGWTDTDGHGTAMASLIAGHGHGANRESGVLGLAPEAKILPIKTSPGDSERASTFGPEGIRWAADNGAKVINFSGGGIGFKEAVDYALARDVVVVAAAGNTTQGVDYVGEPASLPGVVAVSGVGKAGAFSETSAKGSELALAAPAVDIMNVDVGDPRYSAGTGTSNSTALVSAAAALVRAKYPKLNAASVIERLIRTADDKGPKGRDDKYGFGVVNPLKALTADVAPVEKNPLGGPIAEPSPGPSDSPASSESPKAAAGDGGKSSSDMWLVASVLAGSAVLVTGVVVTPLLVRRRRRFRTQPPQTWPYQPSLAPPPGYGQAHGNDGPPGA